MDPVASPKFAALEMEVLAHWKQVDAFRTSIERNKDKPNYTFYDGPPFATGLPHYGHILAGTIKDIVTRYAHQTGHNVTRRFGWDCHGLPVEYEIDKKLGIKSSADVDKMGIDKYNAECRAIVMRYSTEWEEIVTRLGRWIDFENDYKTMNISFMESVWWVFSQLFAKGLVYKGFKVMPYSTAVHTPLSNFEARQAYKDVVDPAVSVSFPLIDEPDVSFVAWTTTPWTLPSNLALVVHSTMQYVKVEEISTGNKYILLEARLVELFPGANKKKKNKEPKFKVLEKFEGKTLDGKKYKPLFDYFEEELKETAFRVVVDDYVTADAGTGVVHCAPAFGEDDYRVSIANGIVSKDGFLPCPVDADGNFTARVKDFVGRNVKEADTDIIQMLKDNGRLVRKGKITHSYPFCWRSDTPLIYRAVPSWFIRVEQAREKLTKNNAQTYWVPEFVKEKRFHNWLENARDWAVSRNRYWGTPLPIWTSEDGEEVVVIGSVAELEEKTGVKVTDLHRESIDGLTIPSKREGQPPLKRVPEVFDCWFESGSMPYAQQHYPFENKEVFESGFPADFIAEGIDQTRGWFYTLLVLSTHLFDKPPFKNLIVNGMVLAEDGKKMSKRLKNYPDPVIVANKYGADAMRLYLVNSPAVHGEDLKFTESGVKSIVTDVFLPWFNSYRFLAQTVNAYVERNGSFAPLKDFSKLTNVTDVWIIASCQSLIKTVREEMTAYRLYTVAPKMLLFLKDLSNWYLRLNRSRLKGTDGEEESHICLSVLFSVLYNSVRALAPFTPFITETMYQNLKNLLPEDEREDSVHYLDFPEADESLINEDVIRAIGIMQVVMELGRRARDRRKLPIKLPLTCMTLVHSDEKVHKDLKMLEKYICDELNILKVELVDRRDDVVMRATPGDDLGRKLKRDFKPVKKAIAELTQEELIAFDKSKEITLCDRKFGPADVHLVREYTGSKDRFEAVWDVASGCLMLLDVVVTDDAREKRLIREMVNRVQRSRKQAKLVVADRVLAFADCSSSDKLQSALKAGAKQISEATGTELLDIAHRPAKAVTLTVLALDIDDEKFSIELVAPILSFVSSSDEEGVAAEYFAQLDYAVTAEQLKKDKKLSTTVNGKNVEFQLNKTVFLSPRDKLEAQ